MCRKRQPEPLNIISPDTIFFMLSFRNTSEHWDISGDNPRSEGNDPNGMMNTKVSVYITTVLVLIATLMCYATAEEMTTLNSPGQQIAPGMTNDSPQGGMNDNGNPDNYHRTYAVRL